MSLMTAYNELLEQLSGFQSALAQVQGMLARDKDKETLGQIMSGMEQAQTDLEREYPKVVDQITESLAQTQATAQKNLDTIAEIRAQMAAEAAQPASPPPPAAAPKPPVEIDATSAEDLRMELLQRFGGLAAKGARQAKHEDSREIWQDWDDWKG